MSTKATKRRGFFRREPRRGLRITERDVALLAAVHEHRFLRTDHLLALLDGSHQVIRRRLLQLFHHGFLDRPRAQLEYHIAGGINKPRVYGLADKGADVLAQRRGISRNRGNQDWKNRSVKRLFLDHALATADVLVAAELAARERDDVSFIRGRELWTEIAPDSPPLSWSVKVVGYDRPAQTLRIVPDAVFALEFQDRRGKPYRVAYFVEIDRGTMPVISKNPHRSSIYRKLAAYHESWKERRHREVFGTDGASTLFVTTSLERLSSFRRAAARACERQPAPRRNGRHLLFGVQSDVVAAGVLPYTWQSVADAHAAPLLRD